MATGRTQRRGRGAAKGRGKPAGLAQPVRRDPGGVVVKFEPFYRVARRIPRGRVATYGQVAALSGRPRGARLCGYALSALRNTVHDVPWQRVLGARGAGRAGISLRDPIGACWRARAWSSTTWGASTWPGSVGRGARPGGERIPRRAAPADRAGPGLREALGGPASPPSLLGLRYDTPVQL
jgi:alkylated DNA nucleotide flippase Atl1